MKAEDVKPGMILKFSNEWIEKQGNPKTPLIRFVATGHTIKNCITVVRVGGYTTATKYHESFLEVVEE